MASIQISNEDLLRTMQIEREKLLALVLSRPQYIDKEDKAYLYTDMALLYKRMLALAADVDAAMRQIITLTIQAGLVPPANEAAAARSIQNHHARSRKQRNGKPLKKPV